MKQLLLGLAITFAFGTAFAQDAAVQPQEQPQDIVAPTEGEAAPVAQQTPAAAPGVPVAKVSPKVSPGIIAASVGGLALVALAVGGGSSDKKPDRPSSP